MLAVFVYALDCQRTSVYASGLFSYCTREFEQLSNVVIDESVVFPESPKGDFAARQSVFAGLLYIYNVTGQIKLQAITGARFALVSLVNSVDLRSASLSLNVYGKLNALLESFSVLSFNVTTARIEFCQLEVMASLLNNFYGLVNSVDGSALVTDSQYNGSVVTQGVGAGLFFKANAVQVAYYEQQLKLQCLNEAVGFTMYQGGDISISNSSARLDVGGRIASFMFGQLGSRVDLINSTLRGSVNALQGAQYVINTTGGDGNPYIVLQAVHLCVSGYNLSMGERVTCTEDANTTFCHTCPKSYYTDVESVQCCPENTPQIPSRYTGGLNCFTLSESYLQIETSYKVNIKGYYQRYGDLSILADAAPSQNVEFRFDRNFAYMLTRNLSVFSDQLTFHNVTFFSEVHINNGAQLALFRFSADGTFYSHVKFEFANVTITKDAGLCFFQYDMTNAVIANVVVNNMVDKSSEGALRFVHSADANATISHPTHCFTNDFNLRMEGVVVKGSYYSAVDGALLMTRASALVSLAFRNVLVNLTDVGLRCSWSLFVYDVANIRITWYSIENSSVYLKQLQSDGQFNVLASVCNRTDAIMKNMSVEMILGGAGARDRPNGVLIHHMLQLAKLYLQNVCVKLQIVQQEIGDCGLVYVVENSAVSVQYMSWVVTVSSQRIRSLGVIILVNNPSGVILLHGLSLKADGNAAVGTAGLLIVNSYNAVIESKVCKILQSQIHAETSAGLFGYVENASLACYSLNVSGLELQGTKLGVVSIGHNVTFSVYDSAIDNIILCGSTERQSALVGTIADSYLFVNSTSITATFQGANRFGAVLLGEVLGCSGSFTKLLLVGQGMIQSQTAFLAGKIIWSTPTILTVANSTFKNGADAFCIFGASDQDGAPIPLDAGAFVSLINISESQCIGRPVSFVKAVP